MNLQYSDILKLKGAYLTDKAGKLYLVKSSTKNKVILEGDNCKITILTSIFEWSKQKNYELAFGNSK